MVPAYEWPGHGSFVDRARDLTALARWWEAPTRDVICLLGRRRVGKSWLVREFANGKPAIILVADRLLPGTQMGRFAERLEPLLGVRPSIGGIADLIRVLYQLGREQRVLAVIDELPYLLPDGAARQDSLSAIQAVLEEERDRSETKLILCGSLIAQMESLIAERSPLSGRLRTLDLWPMSFSEARHMAPAVSSPDDRILRYSLTGGMARHLAELSGRAPLSELVCERMLDRRAPLFDDPRAVLVQELRSPATYFTVLQELAERPAGLDRLAAKVGLSGERLNPYLTTLESMRLVASSRPVGAHPARRSRRFRLDDGFIRFWFRFVFPNQEALQTGLRPRDLWATDIEPFLASHTSATFEALCTEWTRVTLGSTAPTVGSWWGPALHALRRQRVRLAEEVDVVGVHRQQLKLVGECKWTAGEMPVSVLTDLLEHKVPAILQDGSLTRAARSRLVVLLFARSGFSRGLREAAAASDLDVRLVDVDQLVADLDAAD